MAQEPETKRVAAFCDGQNLFHAAKEAFDRTYPDYDPLALARLLVFSQDQDLSEVAKEVRTIVRRERRWIKRASAFPVSERSRNVRGIRRTDWKPIQESTCLSCLDPQDDRPKS